MSKYKFTAAPWKRALNLSRNGSGKPRAFSPSRIVDANNMPIAYAYPRPTRDQQVSNTNLIAAAPELYAELEKFVELCYKSDCEGYARHAEEILRKARGESEVSE